MTGVQTCALPILRMHPRRTSYHLRYTEASKEIVELDDDEVENIAGGGVGPSHGCGSKMKEEYEKECTWLW